MADEVRRVALDEHMQKARTRSRTVNVVRIIYRAYSRRAFAAGAIRAAKAIHGQSPGWYGPER